MKKILFVVILVCAGMAANAQFYLGGSLGFGIASGKTDGGDKIGTTLNFSILPDFGYSFNEKWDLGITAGFGMAQYKPDGQDAINKTKSFGVAPYVRYSLVEFGKFKAMLKGEIYFTSTENPLHDENPLEIDYPFFGKKSNFGLNITPVLGYNLSDHFILLANLNFCSLNFDYEKFKDADAITSFNLGFDTNNLMNTGFFQIGFAYIF